MMALRKIRRIPIVAGRKLVGIVSHGDVYRAIFDIERWPLARGEGGQASEESEGRGSAAQAAKGNT